MTDKAACSSCGRETTANLEQRFGRTPLGQRDGNDYTVGVCPTCETLDMVTPGAAVRACLRLLGKPESDWVAFGDVLLDMEIDPTGVLFETSPAFRRGPQKPFAHVTRETKDALKRAYARVLADRVAATLPQPALEPEGPPSGSACLCCGLASQIAPWGGPLLSTGFTRDSRSVEGWLCEVCTDVYSNVGAVGPSFFERAFQRHTGIAWSPRNIRPWVAVDVPPQAVPFGWMEVEEEPLTLDPVTYLQMQVSELTDELAALRSEVEALRGAMVPT